jgi:hypothetical protein
MRALFIAGLLIIASPAMMWAQTGMIHIRVVEGEGASYAAGSRATQPLVVEVTDETGKPLAGAAVSFHFPEQGPSGLFVNGLRTDLAITDAGGRASIRSFQLNRTAGSFQLRIVASKDQARAGIVSSQNIAEPKNGPAIPTGNPIAARAPTDSQASGERKTPVRPVVTRPRHSARKWVLIGLVVAGAAAGGTVARSRASFPGTQAAVTATTAPNLGVGIPIVTLVNP